MDCYLAILKQNNRLSAITESSSEASTGSCKPPLARAPVSHTVSITTKMNLQNEPAEQTCRTNLKAGLTARDTAGGFRAQQMVLGDCRIDSHSGRRIAGAFHANLRRYPDRGCALQGRCGQHHERAAIINGLIALATVIVGYAALWLANLAFKVEFRFLIIALKLMGGKSVR